MDIYFTPGATTTFTAVFDEDVTLGDVNASHFYLNGRKDSELSLAGNSTPQAKDSFTKDTVAPQAVADASAMTEDDTTVSGNAKTNDTSLDGSEVYSISATTGTYGSIVMNSNGTYTYTRNATNLNGMQTTLSDTFAYTVTDAAGNSTSSSIKIDITPVNDAPINTVPSAQTTNEDTTKVITGLSISDVDAGSGSMTVTLSVTNGTLAVTGGTATISGSGTDTVTLTGTVAQINDTLSAASSVTYNPNANYNGSDTLTMTTSDNGNTGSGGTLTDVDTVTITVDPVSDAPNLTIASTTAYSNTVDFSAGSGNPSVTLFGTPAGTWDTDNPANTLEVYTINAYGVTGGNSNMNGNVMDLEQNRNEASNIYTNITTNAGEVYTFEFDYAAKKKLRKFFKFLCLLGWSNDRLFSKHKHNLGTCKIYSCGNRQFIPS